jgi:hypothetical protein
MMDLDGGIIHWMGEGESDGEHVEGEREVASSEILCKGFGGSEKCRRADQI